MKCTGLGMCICSTLPFREKRKYEWLLGNICKPSVTTAKIESMLLRKRTPHK